MTRALAVGSLAPAVWTVWSFLPSLQAETDSLALAADVLCAVLATTFWVVVAYGLWSRRRYAWRLALIGSAGVGLLGAIGLTLWFGQWAGLWTSAGGLSVENPGLTFGLLVGLCLTGGGEALYLAQRRIRDEFQTEPHPWL
jgi:hypothetical protein